MLARITAFVLKINRKVVDGNVMSSIQTQQWERHREARENKKSANLEWIK